MPVYHRWYKIKEIDLKHIKVQSFMLFSFDAIFK